MRKNKRRAPNMAGRGAATVTARGLATARERRSDTACSKKRDHPQPTRQRYAVSDGRETVGTVVRNAHRWRAFDTRSVEIGTYTSLRAAIRALPGAAP
jgi:hypothetical protein